MYLLIVGSSHLGGCVPAIIFVVHNLACKTQMGSKCVLISS